MIWLADLILVVHFGIALFIVGGLILIWTGAMAGWQWIRSRPFRYLHLAAIVFVALEALAGKACPLTVWEDALRGASTDRGFVARWIHRVLFYNFPEWVFSTVYVVFALAVALTMWRIPPRKAH